MSKRNPVGGRCERSPKITIESRRDTRRLHIQYPHDLRDALRPKKRRRSARRSGSGYILGWLSMPAPRCAES
jgi:hypothetical protein